MGLGHLLYRLGYWTGVLLLLASRQPSIPRGHGITVVIRSGLATVAWLREGSRFAVLVLDQTSCPDRGKDATVAMKSGPFANPGGLCVCHDGAVSKERRYPGGGTRRMRIVDYALIDERGERFEQDRSAGANSHDGRLIADADRLVQLSGRDAPSELTPAEFTRLVERHAGDDDLWIVRFARPGRSILGIDVSNCPA
jgi:hypothetical protein